MTTQNCSGCRYWSERLARVISGGPLEAWCLSGDERHAGRYTTERMVCDKWANNDLGAIDDPSWGDCDSIEQYALYDAKADEIDAEVRRRR